MNLELGLVGGTADPVFVTLSLQGNGSFPNLYEVVATSPGTLFFACEVDAGGHCTSGQKIEVEVMPPPSPSLPPPSESAAARLAPAHLLGVLLAASASLMSVKLW